MLYSSKNHKMKGCGFGEKVYFLSEVYPESNFTTFAVNLQADQTNIY